MVYGACQKEQTFYWDGNVAAMEEAGHGSYYMQDDLGSPMLFTDEEGEIRESYGYDEFGQNLYNYPEGQLQPFGYTGYQMEAVGELYFAQARRYDAGAGRFVSEDKISGSIEIPFSLNKYGYCWNNPLILVDLNGLNPVYLEEGREAHFMLQIFLEKAIPGVDSEVRIAGASVNGNDGRADLIYYRHDGVTEIYEIKPWSYAPGKKNNAKGKAQLERYISHHKGAKKGTSLAPVIELLELPSVMYPDRMIQYCMYPVSDPGMIYWRYVTKPKRKSEKEKDTEESRNRSVNEETLENVGKVAIVGGAIFAIVWTLGKWIVAGALAPSTGGGSLGIAACTP